MFPLLQSENFSWRGILTCFLLKTKNNNKPNKQNPQQKSGSLIAWEVQMEEEMVGSLLHNCSVIRALAQHMGDPDSINFSASKVSNPYLSRG